MKTLSLTTLAGTLLVSGTASAQAVDATSLGGSVSLRAFVNRASGIGFGEISADLPGAPASINSDTTTSALPSLSLRYGRLSLNGSYHLSTNYRGTAPEEGGLPVVFRRKEWDLSAGYSPLPNIVLSAGWKQVHVDSPDAELGVYPMRLAGPFVGAGMSASLAPDWSVYGSVSLGRSKLKLAGAQQGRSGDYMASEFGVRYALQAWLPSLSGAGLLFGYRTQVYRYRDVPFLLFDTDFDGNGSIRPATRTVRQGVDGLTVGIAYSF
jgi:hypothetical protein